MLAIFFCIQNIPVVSTLRFEFLSLDFAVWFISRCLPSSVKITLTAFTFHFFFSPSFPPIQAVCLFHCLTKRSGADCPWRPIPLRVKCSPDTRTETCWASLQLSIRPVSLCITEHWHCSKTWLSLYLIHNFQRKVGSHTTSCCFNRHCENSAINKSSTSGSEKSVEPANHPTTSAKQSVAHCFTCFNRRSIHTCTSPAEAHLCLVRLT